MALEDYYRKLNFVEYKRVPDGFGGWKDAGPHNAAAGQLASWIRTRLCLLSLRH